MQVKNNTCAIVQAVQHSGHTQTEWRTEMNTRQADKSERTFSQEDIAHAMRFWGCSERQAINGLIAEAKRLADD